MEENKAKTNHADSMEDLKKTLPQITITTDRTSVPNTPRCIANAADTLAKHPEYDTAILGELVQTGIGSMKGMTENIKITSKAQELIRVFHTFIPRHAHSVKLILISDYFIGACAH